MLHPSLLSSSSKIGCTRRRLIPLPFVCRFMGRVLENLEQQSSLLARQDAMLISELLVILKRTLDLEAVPYNHR
jgi:hypothetical protein